MSQCSLQSVTVNFRCLLTFLFNEHSYLQCQKQSSGEVVAKQTNLLSKFAFLQSTISRVYKDVLNENFKSAKIYAYCHLEGWPLPILQHTTGPLQSQ